jgi:hypothetical protein
MDNENIIPEDLRADGDGRKLWAWLCLQCDGIESCRPLAVELCRVADRLQEVRAKIESQGLTVSGARGRSSKNSLLDVEIKLQKSYQTIWKGLGLSDKPPDDEPTRPVGRPPANERLWRG